MSALCQTGGVGGEYVCRRRSPPGLSDALRILLSLSTHLVPAICLVQPWERSKEKESLTGKETERFSQPDVHIFLVRIAGESMFAVGLIPLLVLELSRKH